LSFSDRASGTPSSFFVHSLYWVLALWSLFCSDIEMKRGLKLHTASWSSADCVVEKVKCAEETDSDWVLPMGKVSGGF
jgi:hypothetical protein